MQVEIRLQKFVIVGQSVLDNILFQFSEFMFCVKLDIDI